MAVKKKTKKRTTKKKVLKKKVSKVSTSEFSVQGFEPFDRDAVIDSLITDFDLTDIETIRKFAAGTGLYRRSIDKAENGEFRGDFTRETFDSSNRFSRVLLQQGRVQLDADWNEQSAITAHQIRSLASDVGSEHWGPHKGAAFAINKVDDSNLGFLISPGHYYVDGVLCEVGLDDEGKNFIAFTNQTDYPLPSGQSVAGIQEGVVDGESMALIYLDVWERHYNYINDDSIREVALGGPDTATRAKTIWQVKYLTLPFIPFEVNEDNVHPFKEFHSGFLSVIEEHTQPGKGKLCAKIKDKSSTGTDPCLIAPESRYRGNENQLYRVEIHKSGVSDSYTEISELSNATYKWSRENSSVVFPVTDIQGDRISVEHLGKDCRYGLKPNDWVELIDDDSVLQNRADNLLKVESIDSENRIITLKEAPDEVSLFDESKHPYLRRWDHSGGGKEGLQVVESSDGESWLELEDGVLVKFNSSEFFELSPNETERSFIEVYKTGDYWLIPARTITGDIEWPRTKEDEPQCIPAQGIIHHYAPLALFGGGTVTDEAGNTETVDVDLRRILKQAWE